MRALRSLIDHVGADKLVLIGGAAVARHTHMAWRTTADMDRVVAVADEAELDQVATWPGWRRDPDREVSWFFEDAAKVDLIPATRASLATGRHVRRSGTVLNVVGLDLVFPAAELREVVEGLSLKVCPLPVIVLLKIVSFLDLTGDRQRDLWDMAWGLHLFVDANDERRFHTRFTELGIEYDQTSAFLLGEALRPLLDERHRERVQAFLREVEAWWLPSMARRGPDDWLGRSDRARNALAAFRMGCGVGPGDGPTPAAQ